MVVTHDFFFIEKILVHGMEYISKNLMKLSLYNNFFRIFLCWNQEINQKEKDFIVHRLCYVNLSSLKNELEEVNLD